MRTLVDVQKQLSISAEKGLSGDAVAQSAQLFGRNTLTPLPREPLWKKFIEKFDEPIIKILLAAALLSMAVDLFKVSRTVGGIGVGLVALAVLAAYVLKQAQWIPTILFGGAIVLFILGLTRGHFLVEVGGHGRCCHRRRLRQRVQKRSRI